jgi:hypothetical protein
MAFHRHAASWLAANAAKILIVSTLAVPLAATLLSGSTQSEEQRALAPAPPKPVDWKSLLAWPSAADAWVNDHFGGRARMVALYARLRHDVFGRFPTNQVMLGREGRVFLAAHNKATPYNAISLSCGWDFHNEAGLVAEFDWFARLFRARGVDARLLIVPSAPIVYSEQLQPWQAERCQPGAAPATRVLSAPGLEPAVRERIYFPLAEMRAIRTHARVIPLTFFHWSGQGAQAVAALTEEHFWHRGKDFGAPIPLVAQRRPSDIQWLFPGIEHDSIADEPDFSHTTITPCFGPACFPELKPALDKIDVLGRFTNSAPGLAKRLVLVTDSYGLAGAPLFARYYSEVVYMSTNMLARLSPDDVARLRPWLFRPGSGDEVLFLYHDASAYSDRLRDDLKLLKP